MAFLGSIGKVVSRAVAAVATGGASEIAQLAGGPSARKSVEAVFTDIPLALGQRLVQTVLGGGPPTLVGPGGQTTVIVPNVPQQFGQPSGGFVSGGNVAFGQFSPFQATGGNPAWRSSGLSVGLSPTSSRTSVDSSAGKWEVSSTSVRLR